MKQFIAINISDNSVLKHIALYKLPRINNEKSIVNGNYDYNLDKFLNLHHTVLIESNTIKDSIKSLILNLLHSNSKYKIKYVFHNDKYDAFLTKFAETFYHYIELEILTLDNTDNINSDIIN